MPEIDLRLFRPSDAPWIARAHGELYARDEGFDDTFQPLVEQILREFIATHDPARERGWVAERDGQGLGCIFCTCLDQTTAKLRLFLTLPAVRGQGVGHRLLQQCMEFAHARGYAGMQLWTHESHAAACALYRRAGWVLTRSEPVHSFGCDLVEQTWKIDFDKTCT